MSSDIGGVPEAARVATLDRGYGWPIRPFNVAHPVRGYFGDPRFLPRTMAFHFGIDIVARAGTPVYAVKGGVAHVAADSVAVVEKGSVRAFGYWHVAPLVRNHETVREHQLIGRVQPRGPHRHYADGRHLHFTELSSARYRDPLRPNALEPWTDTRPPAIRRVMITGTGGGRPRHVVDVTVDAFDKPPLAVPPPWADMPVSPARVSWRVMRGSTVVRDWETAVDFRRFLPPRSRFSDVYAGGTRQNRPSQPGLYLYVIARDWSTRVLADGVYHLEVAAADQFGNAGRAAVRFTVVDGVVRSHGA